MPGCKQTSQRAAAAAALLLLLPLARALAEPPKRELPKRALDVIVVGGGMAGKGAPPARRSPLTAPPGRAALTLLPPSAAGVTAARNLTDAGYKVLVLEGRDRSGGRLWAAPVPGGYVDLGAMWIHDAIPGRNELFDAVVGKGLALSPRQDYGSIATYSYATGQRTRRSSYLQVGRLGARPPPAEAQLRCWIVQRRASIVCTPSPAPPAGVLFLVQPAGARDGSHAQRRPRRRPLRGRRLWRLAGQQPPVLRRRYGPSQFAYAHELAEPVERCGGLEVQSGRASHEGGRIRAISTCHALGPSTAGNITSLSTARLGDAKSIPAVDVMLKVGGRGRGGCGKGQRKGLHLRGTPRCTPPFPFLPHPLLQDGFPAIVDKMKQGLDIQYNAGAALSWAALRKRSASLPCRRNPAACTCASLLSHAAFRPHLLLSRPHTVVTGIAQDAEGVTIATADGTAVRAPFAIVTPSLGVLKSRNLTFEPALPAAKLQAIEQMVGGWGERGEPQGGTSRGSAFDSQLNSSRASHTHLHLQGFGVLDKVVLVFDKPFWPTDVDFILREVCRARSMHASPAALLPPSRQGICRPACTLTSPARQMPDWSGRFSIFLNYWKLFKIPALVSIHVADTAKALEQQADQEVVGEALAGGCAVGPVLRRGQRFPACGCCSL